MFKTVNFNIYEENLEDIVYGDKEEQKKAHPRKESSDQPIPKPPPQYWKDPLNYKRRSRGDEGAKNIL